MPNTDNQAEPRFSTSGAIALSITLVLFLLIVGRCSSSQGVSSRDARAMQSDFCTKLGIWIRAENQAGSAASREFDKTGKLPINTTEQQLSAKARDDLANAAKLLDKHNLDTATSHIRSDSAEALGSLGNASDAVARLRIYCEDQRLSLG